MNEMKLELTIQLLSQSELPHATRANFLSGITPDSPIWRKLALAFVEQQVLNEALSDVRLIGGHQSNAGHQEHSSKIISDPPEMKAANRRALRPSIAWLVAVVACLLIGFIGGRLSPDGSLNTVVPSMIESSNSTANGIAKVGANSTAENNVSYQPLPLADALARCGQPIPVSLRRELMKCGYLITELDRVSTVRLPSGKTVDLPVRSVAVTYLGPSAFQ